jgi:galactokinase
VSVPAGWTFVIATSGVVAEKTGAARERYNDASRQVARLLQLWNAHQAPAASLADALATSSDAAAQLRQVIQEPVLNDRLSHFIAEDARVEAAATAIADADLPTLSRLAEASQDDAERLLGNQVEETRALVRLARATGAAAATSFGAGFGGSVWALVAGAEAPRFAREWTTAYCHAHPELARHVEVFVTRGAQGMTAWPVA